MTTHETNWKPQESQGDTRSLLECVPGKRYIATGLAAVAALSLAGCGKNAEPVPGASETNVGTTQSANPVDTQTSHEMPGTALDRYIEGLSPDNLAKIKSDPDKLTAAATITLEIAPVGDADLIGKAYAAAEQGFLLSGCSRQEMRDAILSKGMKPSEFVAMQQGIYDSAILSGTGKSTVDAMRPYVLDACVRQQGTSAPYKLWNSYVPGSAKLVPTANNTYTLTYQTHFEDNAAPSISKTPNVSYLNSHELKGLKVKGGVWNIDSWKTHKLSEVPHAH